MKLFDCWTPPTAPTLFAVTDELPLPTAEFVPDELLNTSQSGISIAALPVNVTPVAELVSRDSMQAVPPAGIAAAVAVAVIVGGVERKKELNGSRCWSATVTVTWSVLYPESAGNAIVHLPLQFELPVVSA